MFCPLCKAEYREGFFRCADCGVDLVTAHDQKEPPAEEPSEVVWCGSEPIALSNVQRLLENAKLEFRVKITGEQSASETDLPQASHDVLVRHADYRTALVLIDRIQELLPLISRVKGEPVEPAKQQVSQPDWIAPLAWILFMACYSVLLGLAGFSTPAGGFLFLLPILGALYMIYHAIGHEKSAGKYVLAAFGIPFAFVFYFVGRIGGRKPASAPPNATLERPAV